MTELINSPSIPTNALGDYLFAKPTPRKAAKSVAPTITVLSQERKAEIIAMVEARLAEEALTEVVQLGVCTKHDDILRKMHEEYS